MIKRIYYYFKLKKLLEMKGLIPFVNFIFENYHDDEVTLFRFCMNNYRFISRWLDDLVGHLREDAFEYKLGNKKHAEDVIQRYNQARDFWHKNVKK